MGEQVGTLRPALSENSTPAQSSRLWLDSKTGLAWMDIYSRRIWHLQVQCALHSSSVITQQVAEDSCCCLSLVPVHHGWDRDQYLILASVFFSFTIIVLLSPSIISIPSYMLLSALISQSFQISHYNLHNLLFVVLASFSLPFSMWSISAFLADHPTPINSICPDNLFLQCLNFCWSFCFAILQILLFSQTCSSPVIFSHSTDPWSYSYAWPELFYCDTHVSAITPLHLFFENFPTENRHGM